jgi:biotin operon repressor
MMVRRNRNVSFTRGEQAILDVLVRHPRMTGPQIARALQSTPTSIKVMVFNLRQKGVTINSGGIGKHSKGYELVALS